MFNKIPCYLNLLSTRLAFNQGRITRESANRN